MLTKTADAKGRVTLGEPFANRTVIVEWLNDTEVRVKLARVIAESEAWLYENSEALSLVRRGLADAKARRVSKTPPNLRVDGKLADQLLDDEK